ncbi:MAG: D-alanyl-D-alanine carboxypeptidase/D-alanyl-D-alanine-endopeptidase [Burkholderiaceae bacterium]|jgi:D-alanyl-D-alanine carboxypeptidase/D-alanyl-D-alanine-endopeptidase (penicillin-binding protein 4)|nr:D-alanyl-D-alanine carboxypeptidase/D-alanyl-D-alanine-endopeptidase [Burkholderiaceae bacterium]
MLLCRLIVLWLWLAVLAAAAHAHGKNALPGDIVQALARAEVPLDSVAMLVAPLPSTAKDGKPDVGARLSWQADAPMNPASVMKLVTSYAGLELLGPGYFWKTHVLTQGKVQDGTLRGNLLIQGGGDPKLVLERIQDLLQAIQNHGVRHIEGDILLDNGIFNLPPHDPAAFDEDPLRPYNAGPDGLLLNFKALVLKFFPDPASGRVRVESEPPMAGVGIPSEALAAKGPCVDWRGRLAANFSNPNRVTFAGRYPVSCGEQSLSVAYADPSGHAPRVIDAMWRAAGGRLTGGVKWHNGKITGQPLVTGYSLPLVSIIDDINKFSNNVMAQQLFLTLSVGEQRRGSFAGSRQVLERWWRERIGSRAAAPEIENGSGLSRTERISAAALAALLLQAAAGPHAGEFEQSLPIAGVDGAIRNLAVRSPNSEAIGNARLKTGTLRDVAAIAGYAWGRSGKKYVVVGLINHSNASAAKPALDRLLEWAIRDDRPL